MKRIMDLHLHSKFSAATSKKMDLPHLSTYAKKKGLDILGTGDFTHPQWMRTLKEKLEHAPNGLYEFEDTFFLPTVEVNTVYTEEGKTRKIHHLLLAPTLTIASQINDRLKDFGELEKDGRPTLALTSPELVEIVRQVSDECEVIPAHVWTPWYGLFGSQSGFDALDDCYQDMSPYINAVETGLSSDPAMNWRLSPLDSLTLVSFSDAHSPWPFRLGREATVLECGALGYDSILTAIRENDNTLLRQTIEFYPEEGKYHLDGHRKCDVRLTPEESGNFNNICPECGKNLTLGVQHRVEELADRPKDYTPKNSVPFTHTIPLQEIIGKALGIKSLYSQKVWETFNKLVKAFKNEYTVVFDVPRTQLQNIASERIVEAILRVRNDNVSILPGFDGEYGVVALFDEEKQDLKEQKKEEAPTQSSLSDYF